MAITMSNMTNATSTGASPFTTASKVFLNNTLYLLWVTCRGTTTDATAVSGGGLTWAEEKTVGSNIMGSLWRGMAASGATTDTLTITITGTLTRSGWSLVEVLGADSSGTAGSGAIVQSASTSGTSTGGAVTLSGFGNAANAAFGAWMHTPASAETTTVDASNGGYTALANNTGGATTATAIMTEYNIGSDTSVSATWAGGSVTYVGVAAEIKVASTGDTSFVGAIPI